MEKIGLDKVLHFVLSFALSAVLSLVACYFLPENPVLCGVIGAVLTILVGVGKEVYDQRHRYGFDWRDILADVLGAVVVVPMMLLV